MQSSVLMQPAASSLLQVWVPCARCLHHLGGSKGDLRKDCSVEKSFLLTVRFLKTWSPESALVLSVVLLVRGTCLSACFGDVFWQKRYMWLCAGQSLVYADPVGDCSLFGIIKPHFHPIELQTLFSQREEMGISKSWFQPKKDLNLFF